MIMEGSPFPTIWNEIVYVLRATQVVATSRKKNRSHIICTPIICPRPRTGQDVAHASLLATISDLVRRSAWPTELLLHDPVPEEHKYSKAVTQVSVPNLYKPTVIRSHVHLYSNLTDGIGR